MFATTKRLFVLVLAIFAILSSVWAPNLADGSSGTKQDVREMGALHPNALGTFPNGEKTDIVDEPSFMFKIQPELRARLQVLGGESLKIIVLKNSRSPHHKTSDDENLPDSEGLSPHYTDIGASVLDVPANMIPKIAADPDVRAIFIYELPQAPDPRDFWLGPIQGEIPSPEMWQVTLIQGAVEAWSLGFEGEGVKVAVLDTGVDFGNPDLNGTQARVENPASPYYGWPIAFDSRSMRTYLSTGSAFPATNIWYSDTSITDTDTDLDGFLDSSGYEVGNITSVSGIYHLGIHPDDYLRIKYGDYVGVLVADTTIAGRYDAVFVDLDNDLSFADEKAAVRGDEVLSHDLDNDGLADRSGGLVYFIADGVRPLPYSDSIASDMGIPNIIPTNGDLVAFMINDAREAGGSHGTLCASAIAAQGVISGGVVRGMAPKAKIISIGNIYQGGNWWDNYLFAVEGYDGIPGTGDEANILSLSFGSSFSINKGWGAGERFVDEITTYYAPNVTFMAAAGNGGYGYGTVITPGSSPGVVTVGASTSTWTAEPANYTTWGDIISWSDRGPSALGQVEPDILSVGAYGSGDVTLNQVDNANNAWGIWGGTSMATPVAAGIMSLLYQAYKEAHGEYPTSKVAREIIMSSADNINYDAMLQGAGIANASRAVRVATNWYGLTISPSYWTAGSYHGTRYDAFANILLPGRNDSMSFEVKNADLLNATQVIISDRTHVRTRSLFYSIESNVSKEDGMQWTRPDYLIPLIDKKTGTYEIPPGTDLVKVSVYLDYFDFDPDWDYSLDNRYSLALYDWWDEDGDGRYWYDLNSDGVVQQSEIDGYPNFSEIMRFVDSSQAANRYEARVHDPYERIHDGLLVGIFHSRTSPLVPVTKVNIRADTYELKECDWLSISPITLTIPPGGNASFQATVSFPSNTQQGMYQAFLFLEYDLNETTIPVTATIASPTPNFLINESSGELYDNGAVFGGYNWGWRYESGDWRYYFAEIENGSFKSGQQLVANVSWDYVPTDIDVFLMGPTPDWFSDTYPDRYGPYTLETKARSSDTWVGGGRFLFNTITGGPQEIVAADLSEGLWGIALHNVLNAGRESMSNVTIEIGTVELNPSPWNVGVVRDFRKLSGRQSFLVNSTLNLPDIDVTAFGVSKPLEMMGETILQDNPSDPSTSSWSYQIDFLEGGLLEVSTDSPNSIDIDLFVLQDINNNGIPDWASEIVASSTSPDQTESISIRKPADGRYWIFVHGWSVGGPSSTFDIYIDAIMGSDLQLSDLPTGPLAANQPENFNASYTLPPQDGVYHGIIYAGPSYAREVISVRFFAEVRDDPPEFYAFTPPPGSMINDNQPVIGASFVDLGSGMNLTTVELRVDGFNITSLANITPNSISWATPFLLTEGVHRVNVSARDNFGNYNATEWSFTVDTLPPYLQLLGPQDGTTTNNPNIRVQGFTEAGANLTVNGQQTLVLGNGSFTSFVDLVEGVNQISVVSRDLAGNIARADLIVTRDTIPPALMVIDPMDGTLLNYPTVTVRGSTEPGAVVSVAGQLADVQPDGSFEVLVALLEGPNIIDVSATDKAGNEATEQVLVNVDTVSPILVVDSPANGYQTNNPSLIVSGWTEPFSSLTVSGTNVSVQADGSFSTILALQLGENNFYINATDQAGNLNSVRRTVILDQDPPEISLMEPVDGLVTNRPILKFRGSTEINATIIVNGQFFEVDENGLFWGIIPVDEGSVSFEVESCDQVGNCVSIVREIYVDTQSPHAEAGIDITTIQGEVVIFDGTASDDNDQIDHYTWEFTYNQSHMVLDGPSPSFMFNTSGLFEVVLRVTDRAGNTDSDVVLVNVLPKEDTDQDGIPDIWEEENFGSLAFGQRDDPDFDFLDNYDEYTTGTDPNNPDTDNDGLRDGFDSKPLEPKGEEVDIMWVPFLVVILFMIVLTCMLFVMMKKLRLLAEERMEEPGGEEPSSVRDELEQP